MFSYGITAWQDAAVGALFGQPDSLPVYLRAHASAASCEPGSSRRSGGTATAAPSRSAELVERRDAAAARGFRGRHGQDHAGRRRRELHRRAARRLPRRLRLPRPATAASASSTRSRWREHVTELDAARLPGALPRARRPGGARVPRRDRGGARRATAGPAAGTTSPICRWSHPADVPRFAELGRDRHDPAAVGGARAADGRPDHPVPRRASGRTCSTRSPTWPRPARTWPAAATGRSAARTRCRACTSRSTACSPARAAPRRSRSTRATGSTSGTALTAYTAGSAWVNDLDDAPVA